MDYKIKLIKSIETTAMGLPIFNALFFVKSITFTLATMEGSYKDYPKRSGDIVYKLSIYGKEYPGRYSFNDASGEINAWLKERQLDDIFHNGWDDKGENWSCKTR